MSAGSEMRSLKEMAKELSVSMTWEKVFGWYEEKYLDGTKRNTWMIWGMVFGWHKESYLNDMGRGI